MLKAIIFDMDWVLVESAEAIKKSFEKFFEKRGIDIQDFDRNKHAWRSLADHLTIWQKKYNVSHDIIVQDLSEEAWKYQFEFMTLKPNDNINRLIHNAKTKWIKVAVATSSTKKRAIEMLGMIEVYDKLDAFVTCNDVAKNKPNPDIFLKAAEMVWIAPENCLVIEDAVNGIQAAKAAWMKSLGRVWPHHTKEELSIADMTFTDFKDITLSDLEKIFTI